MKVIAEVSIIPLGVGASTSEYIAECERIFILSKSKIFVHSEGTNIEGDYEHILKTVKKAIISIHNMGVDRVITLIQINSRIDKKQTMEDKMLKLKNLCKLETFDAQ